MQGAALAAGILLGILSRVEEKSPGLDVGLSSNSAWVATAFVLGLCSRSPRQAAALGALSLTAANLAFYGWIYVREPRARFEHAIEPAEMWLVLGLAIPLASTRRPTEVVPAVAGTLALLYLARAGALDPVMPP